MIAICRLLGFRVCLKQQSTQTLEPLSKFLPFALTYGLVWEPGRPGAGPKCFLASLSFGPLRSKVFVPIIIINQIGKEKRAYIREQIAQISIFYSLPVGARRTSWSRVSTLPPAARILALAVSVTLRAATVNLGTSRSLRSSVTVPTTTAILPLKI